MSGPGSAIAPTCRLVAWEVTRSCNLACRHCRAEAHPEPYAGELSTREALGLIDSIAQTARPILIFTGGEPLLRPDIFLLIAHARNRGLTCALAPNGTLLTPLMARLIRSSGVERCSISIDGPDAVSHDAFRGVPGAFDASLRGIAELRKAGVDFQINTTVTRDNLASFRQVFDLCRELGAAAWHIFLLVPMGRASQITDQVINAAEYEQVLHWLYDFRKTTDMQLKATCAPHYYRIMRQRAREENVPVSHANFGLDAMTRGCLAGTGFCFVSHTGQVQPCGYLELNCGNVREMPFAEIWEQSEFFRNLREQKNYQGKCGSCEYHRVCGGCRARAQSMSGNYLAEEPLCQFTPRLAVK